MKKLLLISIMLALSPCAFAGPGSGAGNGGGLAEKNILYAKANLKTFIDLCLGAKTSCGLASPGEVNVLIFTRDNLAKGLENGEIRFDSELAHPGTFLIGGKVRVAKTGNFVGDPVYINSDLIYTQDSQGKYTAMDIPMAASVLVHELGHHDGITNCDFLDRVGTKIELLLKNNIQSIGFNPDGPMESQDWLGATALEFRRPDAFDQLLISSGSQLHNLTSALLATRVCDPLQPEARYLAGWISNLHWGWGSTYVQNGEGATFSIPLQLWMVTLCDGKPNATLEGNPVDMVVATQMTARLFFTLDAQGAPTFLPEKTQYEVVYCDSHPELCH